MGSAEFVGARVAEPVLAEVFDLPGVRRAEGPGAPPVILVQHPLPRPAELAGPLRILSPSNGSAFIALGDSGVVYPRANRMGLTWFLNGRLINSPNGPDRLVVGVGGYELRCVGENGESAGVQFSVRKPRERLTVR